MADIYSQSDVIPLSYQRLFGGTLITGLTVSVMVFNKRTNATLLPTTACTESPSGSGLYLYMWTHGLTQDTICQVVYTVSGKKYLEDIFITGGPPSGRAF